MVERGVRQPKQRVGWACRVEGECFYARPRFEDGSLGEEVLTRVNPFDVEEVKRFMQSEDAASAADSLDEVVGQ
ncbi:MAG: hypothetical protein WC817_03765 [Patescibacteria group bacterium]|jgi:hypothetical protein